MNGLNTIIEELHNNLIENINKSQLPVGIIYFVMKDVFSEVEKGYIQELKSESLNVQTSEEKPEKEIEENTDIISEEEIEEN